MGNTPSRKSVGDWLPTVGVVAAGVVGTAVVAVRRSKAAQQRARDRRPHGVHWEFKTSAAAKDVDPRVFPSSSFETPSIPRAGAAGFLALDAAPALLEERQLDSQPTYVPGMVHGSGFDATGAGRVCGVALLPDELRAPFKNEINTEAFFERKVIQDFKDLRSFLKIDAKASMSYGIFSGSAEASFAQDTNVSSHHITFLGRWRFVHEESLLARPRLSQEALALLNNKKGGSIKLFEKTFGQYFVKGIRTASAAIVRCTVTFASESVCTHVKSRLNASVGGFGPFAASVEAALTSVNTSSSTAKTVHCTFWSEGLDLGKFAEFVDGQRKSVKLSDLEKIDELWGALPEFMVKGGVPKHAIFGRYSDLADYAAATADAESKNAESTIFQTNQALESAAEDVSRYRAVKHFISTTLGSTNLTVPAIRALRSVRSEIDQTITSMQEAIAKGDGLQAVLDQARDPAVLSREVLDAFAEGPADGRFIDMDRRISAAQKKAEEAESSAQTAQTAALHAQGTADDAKKTATGAASDAARALGPRDVELWSKAKYPWGDGRWPLGTTQHAKDDLGYRRIAFTLATGDRHNWIPGAHVWELRPAS